MNVPSRSSGQLPGSTDEKPLLRTLLLTDLCDSTEIVERRGDIASAHLYRDLDQQVMELQQRWRGRLIDRSDGLLLLFERPIDGLGFALDYMKALHALGERHGIPLRARAGLHVGEVLTWRNSVEAVQLGAKPLEVEGLAKPMAARLMTLARPGQILMSAVAEPLAHRAARELGERGDHLLWKFHGRWHFKGVPGTHEVHEVGEPGITPLRAPRNTPKAWRDVPLWRRPASLVAEALLVAGLATGAWFMLKPEPAIAFAERDWVVMGDLRNLTGDARLDESLEQAFRISLEQSRYVNVLSDLKARETLQRMQKPANTELDRAIASEIALRDGVRAVILPTVSEIGGRLRISVEVIDPRTQATVYAESADGKGIESALTSVDRVTGALRGKLGEAMAAIEQDSRPLPQVTTPNMEALKAYAVAEHKFSEGEYVAAESYYRLAIGLDKNFALAYIGVVKALNGRGRISEAGSYLDEALKRTDLLTARDRAYVLGWRARMMAPREELDAWSSMAALYPDDYRAIMNSGHLSFARGLYPQSIDFLSRAIAAQNSRRQNAFVALGDAYLADGRFDEAGRAYNEALNHNSRNAASAKVRVRLAQLQAAMGNQARAFELVANQRFDSEVVSVPFLVGIGVSSGNWRYAESMAKELRQAQSDNENLALANGFTSESLRWLLHRNSSFDPGFVRLLRASLNKTASAGQARFANDAALVHMYTAILALRMGDKATAREIRDTYAKRRAELGDPEIEGLWHVVLARDRMSEGDVSGAIALLERKTEERPSIQARVALVEAYRAAGNTNRELSSSRELRKFIGQAYIEIGCGWCQQSLNVADQAMALLDIAEISLRLGDRASAMQAIAEFDRQWPQKTLPDHLRNRRASLPKFNSMG